MTTLVLELDSETKRFERTDGPSVVHAGETVRLVLRGVGVSADEANVAPVDETLSEPTSTNYPALRARIVHPIFGDVAMYPFPGSAPQWADEEAGGIACDLALDVEQLFAVVRSGNGAGLRLIVERPWPQSVPTVYGEYPVRVEDWPDVEGEVRIWPAEGRYVSALGPIMSLSSLKVGISSIRETQVAVNAVIAALKNLAQR